MMTWTALFIMQKLPVIIIGFLFLLFIPYVVTMLCLGNEIENYETRNSEIRKMYVSKKSPELIYKDSHGILQMPAEVYLKGVVGGYYYLQNFEIKKEHQKIGEILPYEGELNRLCEVSQNSIVTENDWLDLTIRIRTNLYMDYIEQQGRDEAKESDYHYYSDQTLRSLFGNKWEDVEPLINEYVDNTRGLVYGRDGIINRVSEEENKLDQRLYVVW